MRMLCKAVLVGSLTLSAPAAAEVLLPPIDPGLAPIDLARDGGEEGLRLFAAGKIEEAYEAFRRADRVYHAPTLVLYMAHCQKRLGRLASARTLYLKVVDERVPATAPVQFLTAQIVARTEAAHLDPRVPVLALEIPGGLPAQATVRVDGEVTPQALWPSLELDPGDHIIEVRPLGGPPIRRSVNLKEGARQRLSIAVPGGSSSVGAPPPPADGAPRPGPPRAGGARGPLAPAVVAFGAGAAALVVGTATGVLSLGKVAELRATCGQTRICPVSEQSTAATAGQLADVSSAAFVLAGAAVATGVVLVLVRPGGTHREAASVGGYPRTPGAEPALGVALGPRSVGFSGRF